MKFQIKNIDGADIKEIILNDSIWNIEPHKQSIYNSVVSFRSGLRQGTHKVKTRNEVSGGGKKPWKQKGTGRARQGSIRSPQWKGGGVVFGPTTKKNYFKKINKKIKRLAIKSVFSLKAKNNNLIIIDNLNFEKPSTKKFINILNNLKILNEKILVILNNNNDKNNINIIKSLQNIKKINVIMSFSINIYDLLNNNKLLLISENVVNKIEEVYK